MYAFLSEDTNFTKSEIRWAIDQCQRQGEPASAVLPFLEGWEYARQNFTETHPSHYVPTVRIGVVLRRYPRILDRIPEDSSVGGWEWSSSEHFAESPERTSNE